MAKKFVITHQEIDNMFLDAVRPPAQSSVIQQLNQAAQARQLALPPGGKPVAQT